jgi:predicted RNA-binding Zn-ribbon protein involved in translation (DUF1610 family)
MKEAIKKIMEASILLNSALSMLERDLAAVPPVRRKEGQTYQFYCDTCGGGVIYGDKYCRECGRRIKWE